MARILYIEDNRSNLEMVRKMLQFGGHEVFGATTAMQGLAMASREHPDLILMDINLPDMSGLEATAILKDSPQFYNVPVIALTANAMKGDRERCISGGCDGYLAKPILRATLLDSIAYHLSIRATQEVAVI